MWKFLNWEQGEKKKFLKNKGCQLIWNATWLWLNNLIENSYFYFFPESSPILNIHVPTFYSCGFIPSVPGDVRTHSLAVDYFRVYSCCHMKNICYKQQSEGESVKKWNNVRIKIDAVFHQCWGCQNSYEPALTIHSRQSGASLLLNNQRLTRNSV